MELKDKLIMGRALIALLDEETAKLSNPYDEGLNEIVNRAYSVKLRMKRYAIKHGNPPEMEEQLDRMDLIINRLMELQNKRCY
jgi:hypothetical protein